MPASLFTCSRDRFARNRMLREVLAFDWAATTAGPLAAWPDALKHVARTVLVASAPLSMLVGRDGLLLYNDAVQSMFGEQYAQMLGRPVAEVLPHAADFYREIINACYRGETRYYRDRPLRLHRGGRVETAWFDLEFLPILDERGRAHGVFVLSAETTERVRAVRERELVARELSHRIKNLFALTNSLIALSARDCPEAGVFAARLSERLIALGEAHDLIRPAGAKTGAAHPTTCSLRALVRKLLRPYDDGERIDVEGGDVTVGAHCVTPLALVFHELATNAAKHGALAAARGSIRLSFTPAKDRFRILWEERAEGLCPRTPARKGFGSKLLSLSVETQLRGRCIRQWEPDCLRVEIDLPRGVLTALR